MIIHVQGCSVLILSVEGTSNPEWALPTAIDTQTLRLKKLFIALSILLVHGGVVINT